MDCAQDQEEEEVSSLMEETGDSEANYLEVKAYDDYDEDGRESCNGHVKCVRDDDEDEEEEEDDDDDEKVMAWSTWIAMARSEWGKRDQEEEEERSPLVVDEEENRLFWETCLATGYP